MYITHSILNELFKICFISTNSILTEIQLASLASFKLIESSLYVQIMLKMNFISQRVIYKIYNLLGCLNHAGDLFTMGMRRLCTSFVMSCT